MFPSQLVFLLFAQVLFCSQRQKVQNQVSSQPGPYAFALNSDAPYTPQVSVAREPEEDTSRRQELFKNFNKVDLVLDVAAAVETGLEVESQTANQVPISQPISQPLVADELQGINILDDVDMGQSWGKQELSPCESRVSVFNVPFDDIRVVLHIMIKFGPIREAWMIKDSNYGRPNIVLIEYVNFLDARHAILDAVMTIIA